MKTRTTVVAAILLAVFAITLAGCSAGQVRDVATAEVERLEDRLDTLDRALAGLEAVASDDSPLAILPDDLEDLIGRLLPESETIGDLRAELRADRTATLANRQIALAELAQIQDSDSDLSGWLQAGAAIAKLIAPLLPEAALIGGIATAVGAVGRRLGQRDGAKRVAGVIELGKQTGGNLKEGVKSGTSHDVMKSAMAAQPRVIREAVASVKS